MEAYEKLLKIQEVVSDEQIITAISKILSTDQLNSLCDDLATEFDLNPINFEPSDWDLDYEDEDEDYDWLEEEDE